MTVPAGVACQHPITPRCPHPPERAWGEPPRWLCALHGDEHRQAARARIDAMKAQLRGGSA